MAQKTKRKDRQKVFYGHRLTQINTDGNHKRLINFRRSTLLSSLVSIVSSQIYLISSALRSWLLNLCIAMSCFTYLPVTVLGSLLVGNAYHSLAPLLIPVLASQRLIYSQLNSMLYRVVVHKVASRPTINAGQQR
jgi:hypothetical protein